MELVTGYYNMIVRWLIPLAAIGILIGCGRLLFARRKKPEPMAVLVLENGVRFPLTVSECAVGRSRACDVYLPFPSISRRHAVLTLDAEGWRISDARSKGGVQVNGIPVKKSAPLQMGDELSLAGISARLLPATAEDQEAEPVEKVRLSGKGKEAPSAKKVRHPAKLWPVLFALTLFQGMTFGALLLHYLSLGSLPLSLPICFGGLLVAEWVYFACRRFQNIALDILIFFLATLGLCVAASAVPSSLYKQFAALLLGLGMYVVLDWVLADIGRTMKLRYLAGAVALGLFAVNMLFGEKRYGAVNWVDLGFITIQPSEFVKVAFIFAGCATLERLMTTRNNLLFLLFSGCCIGALFWMHDFGTASIFFVGMLLIAYMRSGDWKTLAFFGATAVVGAVGIIVFKPYVADRFAVYRHAWEYAATNGYQQTRTMMAIGSGGLLGVGGGNGNLDRVAAADTDLVFGFVSEEWGLLVGLCAIGCLMMLAAWAVWCAPRASSAYYAIAACAAAGMFLFQAALNVFGSTDLLPLTGVTFPLISNGGSSMAASLAMMAYFRALGRHSHAPDTGIGIAGRKAAARG